MANKQKIPSKLNQLAAVLKQHFELGLTVTVFLCTFIVIYFSLVLPEIKTPKEFHEGMIVEQEWVAANDLSFPDSFKMAEQKAMNQAQTGLFFSLQEKAQLQAIRNVKNVRMLFQNDARDIQKIELAFEKKYGRDYAAYIYSLTKNQLLKGDQELLQKLEQQKGTSLPSLRQQLKKARQAVSDAGPLTKDKTALANLIRSAELVKTQINERRQRDLNSLNQQYGLKLTSFEWKALKELILTPEVGSRINALLDYLYQRPFLLDKAAFDNQKNYRLVVSNSNAPNLPLGRLADTPDLGELLQVGLKTILRIPTGDMGGEALQKLLLKACPPELIYNAALTSQQWATLGDNQAQPLVDIKQGQLLARQGDILSANKAFLLNEYIHLNREIIAWPRLVSLGALVFFWLLSLFLLLKQKKLRFVDKFRRWQYLRMAFTFLCLQFFVTYAVLFFSRPLFRFLLPDIGSGLTFLLPVSLASMLGILLIKREVAIFLTGISALFTTLFGPDLSGNLFYLLGAPLLCVYIQSSRKISSRSQVLVYGLKVALLNMAIALLTGLLYYPSYNFGFPYHLVSIWLGLSAASSLLTLLVVVLTLPLFEQLFDIKTDIKLLELSNSNHPVLLDLMQYAPGSYHHSMAVGTLAEAGAMKIGANALFCRVASYYHDIGKITHAGFFVENMKDLALNPHISLNDPVASTRIIIEHVSEGIRLAEKHRLGREIVSIIREHHGTSLVRYFYDTYQKRRGDGTLPSNLTEKDFRYAGPKPQSIEAALIMIADVCEASCRSLGNPNAEQIFNIVKAVSNHILEDGQLDESSISLKDFKSIQETFIDLLRAQYHSRLPYPSFQLPQLPEKQKRVIPFPRRN